MKVIEYLEKSAEKYPDKKAFFDSRRGITYREMVKEAKQIGMAIGKKGLKNKPVCIYLDKNVKCVCSMFGVLYSGNFYTIIDTQMPENRTQKIMEVLEPEVIITDREHLDGAKQIFLSSANRSVIVYEEIMDQTIDNVFLASCNADVSEKATMFVLFTSGSTGVPKGVVISHRAVDYYLIWLARDFKLDDSLVLASQSPLFFVLTVFDVFITVFTGGSCHFIPDEVLSFPIKLLEFLKDRKVTGFYWVPSLLCFVANLKALPLVHLDDLKLVMFGGEVMPVKQLNMWIKEYPDVIFANVYGSTEITDLISFYVVDRKFDDAESLPIGKPAPHMQIMLLDEERKVVPAGGVGELCVTGPSLADGYYHMPEKTNEVFIPNPLYKEGDPEDTRLVYRMGDLVKVAPDGNLIYLGRTDFQIKHRGYRIELGEIETAVSSLDGIDLNCCLYNRKKDRLELFYTGTMEKEKLIRALEQHLPDYMMPTVYQRLDEMPLNLNGKIDKEALKASM